MDDITIYDEYGPIEGFATFDQLPVMVITAVARFDGKVKDIWEMIYLLPITRIKIKKPTRPVKKIKLPWPGTAGLIMTAKLGNVNRGIFRSITKGEWDNSIMIDISTSEKNINVKLSRDNIQMTGCKSVPMGVEAANLLIDEINKVARHIELMRDNIEDAVIISNQLLDEGVGDLIISDNEPPYLKFSIINFKSHPDDDETSAALRGFFASQLTDCRTFVDALHKLRWLLKREDIITKPLEFIKLQPEMVKYRFNLGFAVDQDALCDLFTEIGPEFSIDYHPDIRNYVKIELDCLTKVEGKNGIKKHTFSIQPSGQTNYSCPIIEEMSAIYYRFIYIINEIRNEIEVKPT